MRLLVLLFSAVLIMMYPTAHAQNNTAFSSTNKFSFPEADSVLSFSTEGSYEEASFENGAWKFVNLIVNASDQSEGLNLTVSAKDSDLTIQAYRRFDITLQGIILSYVADGAGEQTFDFGPIPQRGGWTVIFNEDIVSEGQGWTSDDSRVTVTGATANVTLFYVSYSNVGDDNTNKSFYEQHSVAIVTTVIVTATVIVALSIKLRQHNVEKDN